MPVNIPRKEFSIEDLVAIYEIFAMEFEVHVRKQDIDFFQGEGLQRLEDSWGIDYRPFMGAKFFGQKFGDHFQFHGYNDLVGNWEERDKEFQEEVIMYFQKKETKC